jgi:acetyltransferase-like isoleucine patch superfamily enzyme
MNEKEKMLTGKLYNSSDSELMKERVKCKLLCQEYNDIRYDDVEKREKILKQILGKTREKFFIEQPFICDYGYNIEIGENFYSNHNLTILDCAKVIFGDNVFIGPNCSFYTAEHPLDAKKRNNGLEYAKPIKIGNNVWMGGGVSILSGITVGNNVVIGAGTVVTKDVPENVVLAGNPAKIIR